MDHEKLSLAVNFRNKTVVFFLNMISIEEENKYLERLTGIKDGPDKKQKEYEALVDGVVAWSYQMPTVKEFVDGKLEERPLRDHGNFAEAIREEFAERTVSNERLMNQLVIRYREAMTPQVSFL